MTVGAFTDSANRLTFTQADDSTVGFSFNFEIAAIFLWKQIIAFYGARVHGSVFKMKFRKSRKFVSIETSPGFDQLLGENLV